MRRINEVTGDLPIIFGNTEGLYDGNLWHYLKAASEAPDAHLGYHDIRHSLHVMWLGYLACKYYAPRGMLTKREVRNQLIAHIRHDHRHAHTHLVRDTENIIVAVAATEHCLLLEDKSEFHNIATIIRASEYPHKPYEGTRPLPHQIMQDCDQAQALHPAWYGQICGGLAYEQELSALEMLEGQRKYLDGIRFQTEWAQDIWTVDVIAKKIKETEAILTGIRSAQ